MLFLWVIRFWVLPVYESPKFLASVGRDTEAVEVRLSMLQVTLSLSSGHSQHRETQRHHYNVDWLKTCERQLHLISGTNSTRRPISNSRPWN